MASLLVAIAFGVGIPGSFGVLALAFAVARDGSPFNRSFWVDR